MTRESRRRTVWITGASSGIGNACAATLARRGHKVIALGRRGSRLDALRSSLPDRSIHTALCDVRDPHQVLQALRSLPDAFASVDALINNAGLMLGTGAFEQIDTPDMQAMVMTNCMGVLNTTSALLPALRRSGCGHIVNITSVAAFYPYITGHVYAATKAFVEHFGANLRTELAPYGIRVTNIAPGRVDTEFDAVRRARSPSAQPPAREAMTLTPQDVAEAVTWALEQPDRVSVHAIELMPAGQALSFR